MAPASLPVRVPRYFHRVAQQFYQFDVGGTSGFSLLQFMIAAQGAGDCWRTQAEALKQLLKAER